MYYVGMRGLDDIDFLVLPKWSEEIKELLKFFWKYRSVCCVIKGEIELMQKSYLETIEDKILEWNEDLEDLYLVGDAKSEYINNLKTLSYLTRN